MDYASVVERESVVLPGIRYRIARMSLGRRIELTRRVRELGLRCEFLDAGTSTNEKVEATLLSQEIDRLYLSWGLVGVLGLRIDGEEATAEAVVDRGPEDLCREILAAIKSECHLNGEERKN